jgi:hypothetical protein
MNRLSILENEFAQDFKRISQPLSGDGLFLPGQRERVTIPSVLITSVKQFSIFLYKARKRDKN